MYGEHQLIPSNFQSSRIRHLRTVLRSAVIGGLLLGLVGGTVALQAGEPVRAALGVQIRAGRDAVAMSRRAKARDDLKAGRDQLRVHVKPTAAAYVYVIFSDATRARSLSPGLDRVAANQIWSLPNDSYFNITGTYTQIAISVIVSPEVIGELSGIGSRGIDNDDWLELRSQLEERASMDLSEAGDSPTSIAANMRAGGDDPAQFLVNYSGQALIIQTFQFHVQD